jgi:ABC-type amino acid transport system permease subunit
MTVLNILINYRIAFLKGLLVSVELAAIIWFVGIVVGTALALLSIKYKHVGRPARTFSFLLSGVPVLVFLFWLHYPAQAVFDVVINPFYTAAFTFAVVNIFGVCDLVRNALEDFPQQYITAAQVSGLTRKQTIFKIQLPLIVRHVLPGLLVLQVVMFHTTLFASLISVEEIFRVAQRINAQVYKPVEIYTALGIFFLAVSLPINGVALMLKKKYGRNLSER